MRKPPSPPPPLPQRERGVKPGITGVILAGGRGTRMGGVEKGLLEWQGRPLIAHLIDALAPQVDRIVINANRAQERYTAFGLPLIGDVPAFAGQGPLSGLHAALTHAETELVVTVPCDLTGLPADLVTRLERAASHCTPPLAMAATGTRFHPTLCLAHADYRAKVEETLGMGQRAAWRWMASMRAGIADFGEASVLERNINTPEDLEQLRAQAGGV